jgi:hypothetical protein
MAVLSEQCAGKKEEKDRLQEKIKEIEFKLSRAEVLMKSLGEEQVRKESSPLSRSNSPHSGGSHSPYMQEVVTPKKQLPSLKRNPSPL